METLATVDDVRNAGNYTERVKEPIITFYLELTSIMMRELLGDTNYDAAIAGVTITGIDLIRLKKAEALMAVGFSLPAISSPSTQAGTLVAYNYGRSGEVELRNYTKEIMEMAGNFCNMGRQIIPTEYLLDTTDTSVWYTVFQRVFPSLSEMPTVADIHSEAEGVIKDARGDVTHESFMG